MSDYKKFCPNHYKEIENYELALNDNFVGWICHHKNGEEFSTEWLKQNNMYYNREDPYEFRFVPINKKLSKKYGIPTHREIHNRNKDYSFTQTKEYKNKMSKTLKGRILSIETKNKIGEASKGRIHSNFGEKFKEHFGITCTDNLTLYRTEHRWYCRHNHKCSWEV